MINIFSRSKKKKIKIHTSHKRDKVICFRVSSEDYEVIQWYAKVKRLSVCYLIYKWIKPKIDTAKILYENKDRLAFE